MDRPALKQRIAQYVPMGGIRAYRILLAPTAALSGPRWLCPVCSHIGRFLPERGRLYALCWRCGSTERHRLLWHVLSGLELPEPVLHFAPERGISGRLRARCRDYQTADVRTPFPVDHPGCDLTDLPFHARSFGTVIACHVLEHIRDDRRAIAEIARVLRPGGLAVLPVPILAEQTIEYPYAVASEHGHVRAPGLDYYDRFKEFEVRIVTSVHAPATSQTWIYEDRSGWPTPAMPFRKPMPGEQHMETVPVAVRR
jgi:SAM-dependent methyltransferase